MYRGLGVGEEVASLLEPPEARFSLVGVASRGVPASVLGREFASARSSGACAQK